MIWTIMNWNVYQINYQKNKKKMEVAAIVIYTILVILWVAHLIDALLTEW